MLRPLRKSPSHLAAVAKVTGWLRERFSLDPTATVMVAEVECRLPGCPPVETVLAWWTVGSAPGETQRHHYKIFKPVETVVEEDLPPSWMRHAFAVSDDYRCSCC
jgi:hypothetical protein